METTQVEAAKLYRRAAQDAIHVQDASNASGVARSMIDAFKAVRAHFDASLPGYTTADVNAHPIIVLFLCKLCDLAGLDQDFGQFNRAYQACQIIAAGK